MKYINFEDAGDAVSDEIYMREALKEAQKALEQDEVPIGAVIVCNGKIIGRGHNLTERLNDVTAHAEMQAFTAAANYLGGKYLLDCTLYVTIEPCVMCAGAAYWTQITRIVFGAIDKKRGFSGFGRDLLHPKTTVISGVLENECAALVTSFFRNKRNK
ncbi:nucleoside deaminase [Parapedobacter sp. ISTM3]|uniref:nucleoside deaminase n=1 Tax=Parapedobacter sp. ISTM3 TaxID=2800130 RepID=UPI00190878FA|nr:nucleoside deaminase [Parapedobacter sp. ISTM3]MBK1439752.1 nucleoside deaminase [Parapedobacter sp. ISTM3]